MNDFTKDELNFLNIMISKYQHADLTLYGNVKSKIQSMIDKYCEHANLKAVKHCVDCGVSEYLCLSCAKVTYEGLE